MGKDKGKNISIYLSKENLEYLDKLGEAWHIGRSETIQRLLELIRMWVPSLWQLMVEAKSPFLDELKKYYPDKEKGVKP